MVGYLEDKELEARKRALIAESEIYRETLRLEVHNLRLYSVSLKRRFSAFRGASPVVLALAPLLKLFLERRARPRGGLIGKLLWGWQLYRKFAPAAVPLLSRWMAKRA